MAPSGSSEIKTASIEQFRAKHQVRLIDAGEQGTGLDRLPAGVYGFTYAPGNDIVPLFSKRDYHSFEVHKSADGAGYVIGFVTPEEAAKIETMAEGAPIRLYPSPFESSETLVSVPLSRVSASKRGLPREDGNPLPFTLL